VALILSVIGLVRNQDRPAAIWGLVVSGILIGLFFGLPFVLRCFS
jgi:hypothetical protein